jgi:hypothetical protein
MKKTLLLLLTGMFAIITARAQIQVEIVVKAIYCDYSRDGGDDYGGRFRFYYNDPQDVCGKLMHPMCNNANERCIRLPWQKYYYNDAFWKPLNTVTLPAGTTTFTLFMRTHHERQRDCDFGSDSEECEDENNSCGDPDNHVILTNIGINVGNYPPGVLVPLGRMSNDDASSGAWADLYIRYSIPTPAKPAPQPNASLTTFCANDVLELATNVLPNNSGLQYRWQYMFQGDTYEIPNPDKSFQNYKNEWGDCGHFEYDPWIGDYWVSGWDCDLPDYITVENWKNLTPTNANTDRFARFTPQTAVFNNNLTARKNVLFRAQAVSSEGKESQWSNTSIYNFLPPPPLLTQSNFTIKRSCPFPNNGQVVIPYNAINTPYSQVRWLLKNGHYNNSTCSIVFNSDNTISSTCGLIEKKSDGLVNVPKSSADAPIVIDNLPKGDYTLWVINPGESSGNCYYPLNITITEYPELTLTELSSTNISCFAAADGTLKVQAGGGDPNSGYQFKLTAKNHSELSTEYATITGDVFERTGLPADEYTIYMKNACTPEKSLVITLTEPVKTNGSAIFNQATCYDPANGSVAVTVVQGMGKYTYELWKNSVKTAENANVTDQNHLFGNLLPGVYQVKVLDANRLTCAGWDTTVTIVAPPVLTASIIKTDSVSCFGGDDGAIEVKGSGGSGRYVFTLRNNGTVVSSNTNGLFSGLTAGVYELTASKPADENCNDNHVQTVTVPQRSQLIAAVTVTPITCYGKNNGVAGVLASGGSGSYSYYWEYWNGTGWQHNPFWFPTDVQINSLEPGRYRVKVSDSKSTLSCSVVSQEVTVIEPARLLITNVQTTDAACKADGGRIKITATGGNGNYTYYYSIGDQLHYTAFDENTPLTVNGTYYVKVEDPKGCSIEDNTPYPISLPPIPMDFTLQASDYEGTSVSCYNGNNGSITITATGGSGSGYEYAIGNGAYKTVPLFDQLTAGTYVVTVKDKRGCILSKNITLTQPVQPLQGAIVNKQEVGCPGTPTGSFGITIQNGRAPYQYSIDNGKTFQPASTFANLYTGTYQVVVKDKYDCRWTTSVTLVSIIPQVLYTNTITNVRCFGGNDGAVKVKATGGQPPYQYKWENFANTTDQLTGIITGKYVLQVTDGAGCISKDTAFVDQPAAALSAVTAAQPVCVGSNGHISVNASGGTPPYVYSANNGSSFQNNAVLGNLTAGTYQVVVKDHNNCQAPYSVVINPANAMPEINFLVASGKNALDTLVIKEVSMPIPDSVHWSFDPAAQVIENGASPRIKFNNTGSYWVSMTGYFKGCAYTLRKTVYINPYDANAGLVYTPPVQIIDTVTLYPNPNSGQFSVHVKLNRKQKLITLIQDMGTGREIVRRVYDPALITDDQFVLGNVSNGTYVLRVIAENDSRDVLFVIQR